VGAGVGLGDVVNHSDDHLKLNLSTAQKNDLIEHLKGR
jgi:hypothetical protein